MTLMVDGAVAQIGFPMPNHDQCPGGGALVGGRGSITTTAGTVRASGTMQGSIFPSIDWAIAVRSATLAYELEVSWVLQFPGDPPCPGSATRGGTLVKQ